MLFGAYKGRNIDRSYDDFYFKKKDDENDESKNEINQKILDSILDDDDSKFSEHIFLIPDSKTNPNQKFWMTNYKIPKLLVNRPTYASLCAFFGAEKCFTALSMICQEGITSEQFKQTDDNNRSPIHFACAGSNLNIVRMLYEADFDLDIRDDYGLRPSHYSAMSGTADVMQYLWTKGVDILKNNSYGIMSSFQTACLYGNLGIIKLICENIDHDDQILYQYYHFELFEKITPLHLACEGGHSDVVDYLLNKKEIAKKQLTLIDHKSRTPLLVACQNGCFECVRSLVKFGVLSLDPERKYSAFVSAAAGGFSDIVTFLIKQKEIDINKTDSNNMTALEMAIINGHLNTIKILVQNGALNKKSEMEIGDLFLAACGNFNINIVKYLDEVMNIPYKRMGDTFMRQACKIENEELVNFLIEKECNLQNIKISDFNFTTKWTPFMAFLKNKGLNFSNIYSKEGLPLIVKTIKYGSLDSIKKLISEGIELNKDMIDKYDLVNYSCTQGKTELFHFLIQYNPNIYDSTLFLNKLMKRFINSKTKTNLKRNKEYFNVSKILLNEYNANPNNKEIISELVSNCFIDFIELYSNFGANFDSTMINFEIFRKKNYSFVFKIFKEKNVDFKTLTCNNGNLLTIEALKNDEMNMFNQLISNGAQIDGHLIEKHNLLEIPINKFDMNLFSILMNFHPVISNPTMYLKEIYSNVNEIKLKFNHQIQENALKITEIFLRDFNANPNDEDVIDFVTKNCLVDILNLLANYGADFNSCSLDYSKMTTSKHLPIFDVLEKNGCLFQKSKNYCENYHNILPNMNFSPIQLNLMSLQFDKYYDYRTFLFLLKYTSNEDLINLRLKDVNKLVFNFINEEKNVIDILLLINCFDGILHVYRKLNKIILPFLTPVNAFMQIIKKSNNQELINMVSFIGNSE